MSTTAVEETGLGRLFEQKKFCPFASDGRCREKDCALWIESGVRSMCAWKAIGYNALVEATSIRS